jgi:hypothetical protein
MTHESRLVGANAEQEVASQFDAAGWLVRQSAELDYGRKADVQVVCPGHSVYNLQVSVGPKSVGEQERLAKRGVQDLPLTTISGAGLTAPELVCRDMCERELCPDSIAPVEFVTEFPRTPRSVAHTAFDYLYNGG